MNELILAKEIIICEDSYKKSILAKMTQSHTFSDVKFYPKKEFFQEYFFTYNEETIAYVVKKLNVKVSIAKMYLQNLFFLEDKEYRHSKLQFLKNLKEDLDQKKLLIYNPLFKDYLNDKKIKVIGYLTFEKYEEEVFHTLGVEIIKEKEENNLKYVWALKDMEEEITFVARKICQLILEGVSLNQIKLMNVPEDYYDALERIFAFFHIPVKIPSKINLLGYEGALKFLNALKKGIDIEDYDFGNMSEEIQNKIINILNKYAFISDNNLLYDLVYEEFKNTHLDTLTFENYVELLKVSDYVSPSFYVFLMNFNAGSIPEYKKDEDYITDFLKDEVHLYKTTDYNEKLRINVIAKIKSIKNLTITYKLKDNRGDAFPSSLVSLLSLEEKFYHEDETISYASLNDKIKYAKYLDEMTKYGNIHPILGLYKNNLPNFIYRTFDNSYKGLNEDSLKDYLKEGLTLSYSSLNNYNKCSFRYYLENILHLNPFLETFDTFIGSLFHDVLEKCLNKGGSISQEVDNYLREKEKILDSKEKFYVTKIMKDMEFVINYLREQKEDILLGEEYHEKYLSIDKSRNIPIRFVGIIDKILYEKKDDQTVVAIVDYKTGKIESDINYAFYGLSLQLPIYLYLVSKSHLFERPLFAGFYLEHILDKDLKRSDDYENAQKEALKLKGYSNADANILACFDKHYMDSHFIKSLKMKNDGNFYSYSKVLSNEKITNLINLTENIIDDDITKILKAEFPINPKKIGYAKDVGCLYCPFGDICYKKEADYVILEEVKNLNYLGGEANAEVD